MHHSNPQYHPPQLSPPPPPCNPPLQPLPPPPQMGGTVTLTKIVGNTRCRKFFSLGYIGIAAVLGLPLCGATPSPPWIVKDVFLSSIKMVAGFGAFSEPGVSVADPLNYLLT